MTPPRPRFLARWIVNATQREDAEAFLADLDEVVARGPGGTMARWARAWREILSGVRHARRGPHRAGNRAGGRARVGAGVRAGVRPRLALHLAARGLRHDPATAFTAVLILTLGVAAPTVFFSILWGVGYRSLPVPEGHRVVRLEVNQPSGAGRLARVTAADADLLRSLPELASVGTYTTAQVGIGGSTGPARQFALADLDPEAFELLRVEPVAGRIAGTDEGPTWLAGAEAWAALNETLGLELGETVRIDGVDHVTTGTMPATFGFPTNHFGWRVVEPRPDDEVAIVARLATGVSEAEATRAAVRVWARADAGRPADARQANVRLVGFTKERGEGGEVLLFAGLVVVGLALLLIAIANASNLLLVRAVDRSRSLAIQGALGASRGQLTLQTLLESLLLAAVGGVGGFMLAGVGARYVEDALGPRNFGYHWITVGMTAEVAAFTVLLVIGTAVLAGTLPVARLWRSDLRRLTGGPGGSGSGTGRVGGLLVSVQLGLSCAALVGAGLMVQTTRDARAFGRSLPSDEVLLVNASLEATDAASLARLRERIGAVETGIVESGPVESGSVESGSVESGSVESATVELATGAPGYFERVTPVRLPGGDEPTPHLSNTVGPRFFEIFDVELLRGRGFGPADRSDGAPVAVVNRAWVARHLPGLDPLGVTLTAPDLFGDAPVTIVGIVDDVPLAVGPRARLDRVYFAFDQVRPAEALLLVRSDDLGGSVAALRAAVGDDLATLGVPITLADGLRFMTRVQETFGWLIVIGGVSGFVVATVGLYGLLAFRIRQRRREFGIRLALGANRRALARSVLAVALRQIVPAIVVGGAVAWVLAPVLGILTLGQDPRAPGTYLVVGGVFLATAVAAAALPARQAARIDPVQTLRAE